MKFRFENLDSIRTFAFLSTFLAHAFHAETIEVVNSDVFQNVIGLRKVFSFGVPVFFVLSGFLISFLMLKEQENRDGFSLWKFYLRRVLRIWPVYFIVLLVGFVLFPVVRGVYFDDGFVETANIWNYVLFLSNFDQIGTGSLPYGVGLGPTWSVSVEEQFYLIWPVFLLLFKRRKFIIPILLVLVVSLVLTPIYHYTGKHTIYCMTYLSVGALFGYLSFYYNKWILKLTQVNPIVFIANVVLMIVLMYLYSIYHLHFIMVFSIALLIGYCIVYQCYSGRFCLNKIPFVERLGKYTYGLYLYHVICSSIIHMVFTDFFHIEENVLNVIVLKPFLCLGLSLIVSYVSYRYIERFFLNLKKRFSTTV